MKISVDLIKELRNQTGSSIADCKKALQETNGNTQEAAHWLRRRGLEIASRGQSGASFKEGRIEAYTHFDNKLGAVVEVNCETDFVARNQDFCQFAKDLAIHIAASNPLYVKKEEIPKEVLSQEKDVEQFCKSYCLLDQVFVKDPSITIKDYLGSLISKFGENIFIRRFTRYRIGE